MIDEIPHLPPWTTCCLYSISCLLCLVPGATVGRREGWRAIVRIEALAQGWKGPVGAAGCAGSQGVEEDKGNRLRSVEGSGCPRWGWRSTGGT